MIDSGLPHFPTKTYSRPWRGLWRERLWVRCWFCDLNIECVNEADQLAELLHQSKMPCPNLGPPKPT